MKGYPGHRGADGRRAAEQRFHGDPGLVFAHVGEKGPAVRVADGIQPSSGHPGGAERVVDGHRPARLKADGVQADISGAGPPAGGHENLVGCNDPAVLQGGGHGRIIDGPPGRDHLGPGDDGYALGGQGLA